MADDPELEAIRQKRMGELLARQQNLGGGGAVGGLPHGAGGAGGGANAEEEEERKRQMEEARQHMLRQILEGEARERLSRIALVKPEKARHVEDMIISTARAGRLGGKVSEEQLIDLLGKMSSEQASKTKVTMQRRRMNFDDDDDF